MDDRVNYRKMVFAAEHVGVGKDTIYRWIANKQMPATKIGRQWKFKLSEVEDWARKD